jgi:hypothetical protein
VLSETPSERLEKALDPVLDVDGALRFLAWDNALVSGDGFWTRASWIRSRLSNKAWLAKLLPPASFVARARPSASSALPVCAARTC